MRDKLRGGLVNSISILLWCDFFCIPKNCFDIMIHAWMNIVRIIGWAVWRDWCFVNVIKVLFECLCLYIKVSYILIYFTWNWTFEGVDATTGTSDLLIGKRSKYEWWHHNTACAIDCEAWNDRLLLMSKRGKSLSWPSKMGCTLIVITYKDVHKSWDISIIRKIWTWYDCLNRQ